MILLTCEVQSLEQMTDEKFYIWCEVEVEEEEDDGEKVNLQQHFCLECFGTLKKYCMQFDADDSMMDTLSIAENKVYRFQQEAKKQQLTLMNMWKKWTRLCFYCNTLNWVTFLM